MSGLHSVRISCALNLDPVIKFRNEILIPYENADPESLEFSPEITRQMYDLGLLTLITPKEFGGPALPVADLTCVVRELAYGSASASATLIGNMLGYSAVILYGQPALKKRLCGEFTKTYGLWSFGMTEGGAGSDLVNIQTHARRTKDGFILSGEKNFITNASYSTHLSIFARLFDENGKDEGVCCFYVPGDAKGLVRGEKMRKIGWKKANTGTLIFNNVVLPSENLLGEVGQGLRILTHCLNRSKTLLGAVGVGVSYRALDLAAERLTATSRFGKPLVDQPAIRHTLARLHTKTQAAWLLVCLAAATWDAGLPAVKESSMAKLFGGATASETAAVTMELFGARGYFVENEISRLMNDAKAIEIVEGPTLVQELLIAKEVLRKKEDKANLFRLLETEVKKAAS